MKRLYLAALLLVLASWPAHAQQPAQVIGPITPGDCPIFSSTTIIKDSGASCSGSFPGTIRRQLTGSINFFVDNSTGNDSNDCLAATVTGGHGPCATINHGVAVAKNTVDVAGQASPVLNVATGTGTYAEQISIAGAVVGGQNIQVTGTGSANITIQAPAGQYAVNAQDWVAISFSGFTFGCANGATGQWLASKYAQIDLVTDVKFTECGTGTIMAAIYNSQFNMLAAPDFSGNAAAVISLSGGSRLSDNVGCTISGSPTYSVAFLQGFNSYAEFAASSCTGSFTGLKFLWDGLSWEQANGRSFNSVIVGGANGTLAFGAQTDAGNNPTSPTAVGGVSCPSGITAGTVTVVNGVVTHC